MSYLSEQWLNLVLLSWVVFGGIYGYVWMCRKIWKWRSRQFDESIKTYVDKIADRLEERKRL